MKTVALIDTSVWIDFLRGKADMRVDIAARLNLRTAALCPVTWFEIFRGARGKRELQVIEHLKSICVWLEVDSETWAEAYRIGARAKQAGMNCPMTDVLIAACGRRHKVELIHNDKHFDVLSEL